MILDGKKVVSVRRVSTTLLYCGLEGGKTCRIQGSEQYCNAFEQELSLTLNEGKHVTHVSVHNEQTMTANQIYDLLQQNQQGEELPLPEYDFTTNESKGNASVMEDYDAEHLPLRVFQFSDQAS